MYVLERSYQSLVKELVQCCLTIIQIRLEIKYKILGIFGVSAPDEEEYRRVWLLH